MNLNKDFKAFIHGWDQFWFHPISLYQVGLMRMILSFGLFIMYALRFNYFDWLYSESGLLPLAVRDIVNPESQQALFTVFFANEVAGWWAHLLFVVLLLMLALGLLGRLGTLAVFVLHIGFMQRNNLVIYGADLFTVFWLLYLSLVKHNTYFSVLNFVKKKTTEIKSDLLSTVGIRFIQIQLCLSYAYTGIEKLKGEQWWEGTAVWYALGMKEIVSGDYAFLQNFPVFIGGLTIATLIFEIYFPMAMLYKPLKKYWLLIGLFFHISTALFMNLPFFCLVMLAPYLLFLNKSSIEKFIAPIIHKLRLERFV